MARRSRNIKDIVAFVTFGAIFSFWSGLAIGQPVGPIFRPETYGAKCNNSTDNTAAFAKLAIALNATRTGVVEFTRNCIYRMYPAPVSASQVLLDLTSLKGVRFNGNGATISSVYNFAAARIIYAFIIRSSTGVVIENLNFDQPNFHTRGFDRGIVAVTIAGPTFGTRVDNLTMNGGTAGFLCNRTNGEAKGSGVAISNMYLQNVFYGISAQKGCDGLTATGVETVQAGRSYLAYNVNNHRIQILSDASDGFNDIVVSNIRDAADTTADAYLTSDIRVQYTNRAKIGTGTGVNSYATIQFQTESGAEGFQEISDIYLNLNVLRTDARSGAALQITNLNSTPQSRLLNNVNVSGSWAISGGSLVNFMELMTDKDWSFGGPTGDIVRNVDIRNMYCAAAGTASLNVDGRAILGPFTLNNVFGTSLCTFTPTNMGGATTAFPFLSYNQVWLPTLITP